MAEAAARSWSPLLPKFRCWEVQRGEVRTTSTLVPSPTTSASLEPSYVLKALGVGEELAHSSIRFGIGRFTTEEEVDYVADKVITVVKRLRELSPLYEMVQEGIDLSTVSWTGH